MKEDTTQIVTDKFDKIENKLIDLILSEIKEFENGTVNPTDRVVFSQAEAVRIMRTHQNRAFLNGPGDGKPDTRDFYDIITRMVETGVKKCDIDTKDFTLASLTGGNVSEVFLGNIELKNFLKQTNKAERINAEVEAYIDDGNIVSRKVEGGDIYKPVRLENLYVIDQTAESLEDTPVIERQELSIYGLQKMKGSWQNIDNVISHCNKSKKGETPYFEALMRFGQIKKSDLAKAKAYLYGNEFTGEESDDYVEAQLIMVRAFSKKTLAAKQKGFIVFAEELVPEIVKIAPHLEITRYKPYAEQHLGAYTGTWLREGYRLRGLTYQNRANDIGNQIRELLEDASKMVWWTRDKNLAGKNILSSFDRGDLIVGDHLELLNNVLPNITYLANEWNRNLQDCKEALAAFEVATGEALPSSTSATAVSIQNQGVGEYYDFKREKLGIYYREIYNRWVVPVLFKEMSGEHILEITGDPEAMAMYYEAIANKEVINLMIEAAKAGKVIGPQELEYAKQFIKEQMAKNPKQQIKIMSGAYKDSQMYLDVNIVNESGNKQNKISNALALSDRYAGFEPAMSKKLLDNVASELGFKVNDSSPTPQQAQQTAQTPVPTTDMAQGPDNQPQI